MKQYNITGRTPRARTARVRRVEGKPHGAGTQDRAVVPGAPVARTLVLGLLVAGLLVTGLVGCATAARESFNAAKDALDAGRPLEALVAATEALIEDPEFGRAKDFLRDHADTELAAAESYLSSTVGTTVPEDLERRFDTLNKLVTFYDNLEQVGLPITADKKLFGLIKGWEWSTPMEDYRPQVLITRAAAREGFLTAGYAALDGGDLETADVMLGKVVTKFAVDGSEEQAADRSAIATAFGGHADDYLGAESSEELLHAIQAYEIGLGYEEQPSLQDGLAQAKLEVSDAFVAEGLVLERDGTLESLTQAVALFERALEYNGDNQAAATANTRARTSIAEIHYQDGLELAESYTDPESVDAAKGRFQEAQEWVPEYRDCTVQLARLDVATELIGFSAGARSVQEEFDAATEPVRQLASLVDSAHNGMNDLNFIADKVVQLDGQLRSINNTITVLTPVPVVGQALRGVGTPLSMVRRPVHATAESIDRVRDPFVTPSRNALAKTKGHVDQIISALNTINRSLEQTRTMSDRLYQFVVLMDDTDDLATVAAEIGSLTGTLEEVQDELENVNNAQASAAGSLNDVAAAADLIDQVADAISDFMKPLDAIKGVTDAIDSALNQEIKVPFVGSFSVGGALDSANGLVADAAQAIIDPILDGLDIEIPSIPGLEELQAIFDAVEGYHQDILAAAGEIEDSVAGIAAIPARMDQRVAVIVELTGYN
jgi:tetratricopeptide (TPR) repeat protein